MMRWPGQAGWCRYDPCKSNGRHTRFLGHSVPYKTILINKPIPTISHAADKTYKTRFVVDGDIHASEISNGTIYQPKYMNDHRHINEE